MLRGKAEFGLGSFVNAAAFYQKANGLVSSVDPSLKAELERQCKVWNNKSQIELTSVRSYGDINQGAYLNTSAPQNPAMFTPNSEPATKVAPTTTSSATKTNKTPAPAEESKSDGAPQINLQYDWYQNMTHVFVAYKIKRGGAALQNGGLKVTMTENCIVLENSETDEILTQLDLSNPINAGTSSWTCSAKRIDIKLAKAS